MHIVMIVVLSAVLIGTASWVHHEMLLRTAAFLPRLAIVPHRRTLITVFASMVAHLLQIGLYALAYWIAERGLQLGELKGALAGNAGDYIYFSAATFTTLGVGDITAEGPLRLMAGAQSLNGLILITWSASFTYLSMQEFWQEGR